MKVLLSIVIGFLAFTLNVEGQVSSGAKERYGPLQNSIGERADVSIQPSGLPPPPLPEPGSVPIDGGILGLLAVGAGIGAKKLRKSRKSQ